MFGLGISQATVCGRHASDAVPICLVLWEPHKFCGTSIINEACYLSLVHVTYSAWYNWHFTRSGRRPRMVSSQTAMTSKLRKSQRLSMKVGITMTLRLIFFEKKSQRWKQIGISLTCDEWPAARYVLYLLYNFCILTLYDNTLLDCSRWKCDVESTIILTMLKCNPL